MKLLSVSIVKSLTICCKLGKGDVARDFKNCGKNIAAKRIPNPSAMFFYSIAIKNTLLLILKLQLARSKMHLLFLTVFTINYVLNLVCLFVVTSSVPRDGGTT